LSHLCKQQFQKQHWQDTIKGRTQVKENYVERQKKIGFIGLFLISAIATTMIFQNCSKVNYDIQTNPNVKTNGKVERTASINPTFNTQNSDMKVLFVVDDSYTMSQSQTRLSTAIDSLINPLFGRNVEFKIVSTSGIPNNEVDYIINKKYFNVSQTEITEAQAFSSQNYFIEKTVANRPDGRHTKMASLKNYTQSQFNTIKNKVKQNILYVGVNGSDTEEGFCSAARQLFDDSSSGFFKQGDKAAIIFLTDEDDASTFTSCVSKYQERISNSPVVYYSYLEQRAKLRLEYQVTRDGISTWIPVTWAVGLPNGQYFSAAATCNMSDVSIATNIITQKGYNIRNVSDCTYEAVQSTRYGADLGDDGSVPTKNLCTSLVTFQGATYTNLYSFITASNLSAVAGSCQKTTQPANSIAQTGVYTSVIQSDSASTNMQDLRNALITKSQELFGSGFIYANIIRKSNESCDLQSGQSYGQKYENLALQLPQNSMVESMCATNFSNVLNQVSQFIVTSANNSYMVPGLTDGEVILAVSVKRNGQLIPLDYSQYEAVGSTITLTNYTLIQGDTLEVGIGTN
jgi:hypothetical protein